MSDSLQPRGLQHARLPCPSLSPKVCSNSRPLSQWCHSALSSSFIPFPLALSLSQHQGLFQCVGSSHQVATILELQLQHQSFQWISSVQFSLSVISDSLQPHGLQHARLPCPSPTPGACSNLCPSSQWCHLTISSSVIPFSSCLESFPASGSFPMSQFFASSSQSIGASASPSVLPMSIQDWFLLVLTSLISWQSMELSRIFPSTTFWNHQFFSSQSSLHPTLTSYMYAGKTIALTLCTFDCKMLSLLFNMMSKFIMVFLQGSSIFLISWLQSLSEVTLEPKKIKSVTVCTFSPSFCHEVKGPYGMNLAV